MSFINASTGNTFVDFAYSTASLGVNAGRLGANLLGVQSNLEVVGIGVGNVRRVRVWDDLYVQGDSIVAGNVSAPTFRLVGSLLANRVVTTDASGNFTLFGPTVQTSQIAYLAGLVRSVPAQLAEKANVTGTMTASRVLVSDAQGNVANSAVASTTLAFLDATSSVQTQLDSKLSATGSLVFIGNLIATGNVSAANVFANTTPNQGFFGNGRNITNMSASNLDTGTLNNARLNTTITGLISLTSTALAGDLTGNVTASGNISAVGNVSAANVVASSAASQGFFGNGRSITNMSASNLDTGTLNNARLNTTITGLTSLTSTALVGDLTGNVTASGNISAVGNVSAANVTASSAASKGFFGNGRNITNISASNLDTGTLPNARLNTTITGLTSLTSTALIGDLTGNVAASGTIAAATLTASANIVVGGDAIIAGNLVVKGNTTWVQTTQLDVQDPVIALGNVLNATQTYAGTFGRVNGAAANVAAWYNISQKQYEIFTTGATSDADSAGLATRQWANLVVANVMADLYGNVSATNVVASSGAGVGFSGNGRSITNLSASNLDTGTLPNARLNTTITGLSSLTSTALVGDLTGNVTASGNVLVTGNVSAANVVASSAAFKGFFGNGRSITNMSATNLDAGTLANDRLPANILVDGTLQANAAVSLGPGAKPEPAAGGALISHNAPASGTWISGSYDAPTNQQTIQIVDFGSSYPQSGLVLVYVSGTGKDGFMMASFSKSETSNPDILTILTHKTTSSGSFTWGNCYLRTSGTALYANVDQNVKATSTYLGALARNVIS